MSETTRRTLLKGLAISAPAVWATPIIESTILPAHAETSPVEEPAPAECTIQTLEAEDHDSSEGSIEATASRVILQSDGSSICWEGVNLEGCSMLTVFYSNGEDPGDQLQFTFNDAPIGDPMSIVTFNAWDGPYTSVSTPIDPINQTGDLCLVGTQLATGIWVASIDRVEIA